MPFNLSDVLNNIKVKDSEDKVNLNNGKLIKVSDLTNDLKLIDTGIEDNANNKLQNYPNVNFPRNTPCYICGPKGSGKTYLLAGLMQYITINNYANRIFYVYAENVDTTITRAVKKDILYNIPKELCLIVLMKYLRKKTKFLCCHKFITSWTKHQENILIDTHTNTIDLVNNTTLYWDNLLNELVKLKHLDNFTDFLGYCNNTVNKYKNNETILTIGQMSTNQVFKYNVGRFDINDYDVIVMDDIAQFGDIWGKSRLRTDGLYKYFTITRQNQTTFYLAGQALKQLPKMLREQLGCVVILYGTDLDDLVNNSGYRFSKKMIKDVMYRFEGFKLHDGVLYNYNTNELEYFKN